MTRKMKIVSIGESMVEMSRQPNGDWRQGFAGDTFNTAYYLKAKLDEKADVDYVTCLGDDLYSSQMLDFITQNNIGTQYIRQIAGKRAGLYLIHQQAGDRQFTYWRETSAAREFVDDEALLRQAVSGADLIYFSGITLGILSATKRTIFLDIIKQAQAKYVCFDPNIRLSLWSDINEMQQALQQAASLCDIVLPTYDDEAAVMGDSAPAQMAQRYLRLGAGEVVIKNGSASALAVNEAAQAEVVPSAVDDVVDATGAGDSFNAAYLAARLQGADLAQALLAGHQLAAQVIRMPGALIDKTVMT